MKIRSAIREVRLQVVLLIIVAVLHVLSARGAIPSQESLVAILKRFFENSGLPAVGLLSFTENIIGLNIYFPGSIVILVAMSLTAGNPALALLTFAAIVVPSAFAHFINYALGKLARREETQLSEKLPRGEPRLPHGQPGFLEFFLAFAHPHTAAIVSIRAGATRMSFRRFLGRFIVASAVWNTAWAIFMYNLGGFMQGAVGNWIILIYIYLLGWMVWDLWNCRRDLRTVVTSSEK